MTTPPPRRWAIRMAAVSIVAALGLGYAIPASADQLVDRRQELSTQIDTASSSMGESSQALQDAMARLEASQGELSAAEASLARTRDQVAAARSEDARLAAALADAQAELADAEAAVAAGERAIAGQRDMIGGIAREQYQRQHNLMGVAVLVGQGSSAGLQTRIQLSTTMMDTNQAQLDRLHEMQATLESARATKVEAEQKVAAEKDAAAQVLASLKSLEAAEAQQQASVSAAVAANRSAQQAAQEQVDADKKAYEQLSTEREKVNADIAARDAAAAKAAEAKAEADRKAREAAAAKAAAEAASAANAANAVSAAKAAAPAVTSSDVSVGTKTNSSTAKVTTKQSWAGLVMPVANAPITSLFGMRVHPITRIYKLHDGTDFGAGCGVPIRAVANGRVSQRYFNIGYGNRLFIDHGTLGGKRTTTAYNHLSRYNVQAGQQVKQGQIIGYVGTTGYSTGCHLHFMVWRNGQLVNPQTVL